MGGVDFVSLWEFLAGAFMDVSMALFQLLQFGHLPNHFVCSKPHCWQTKIELVLDMASKVYHAFSPQIIHN
jgi:hypothetical protein